MAVEAKRGCGYRKVGGMYLVGKYIAVECDRLPLKLESCPVCGAGIHFTRSMTEINPYRLFGPHDAVDPPHDLTYAKVCSDTVYPCYVCNPANEPAFIMTVGEKYYTPESFMQEALSQGICKRIPFIPKNMKLGETVVYLAHPKAVTVKEPVVLQQAMAIVDSDNEAQTRLMDADKEERALGIFCAFIPQKVEKLIWESELTSELQEVLEKRGITPMPIPDGDKDHS